MNKNKFLLALLGLSIFLFQCGENPFGAGMENEVEIEIFSGQFNPSSITISAGTRVVWVNKDSEIHSVDPGAFMNANPDLFEASVNMEQNDTHAVTFTKIGTIKYYCSIHQQNVKQGTIIVQQSAFY